MVQDLYTPVIRKRLFDIADEIESAGTLHHYDPAIDAEQFFAELLGKVYGYEFRNLNEEHPNHFAIDLANERHRICIQVTATQKRRAKFDETVERFRTKKLYQHYDDLIILFIAKNFRAPYLKKTDWQSFSTEGWDLSKLVGKIYYRPSETKASILEFLQEKKIRRRQLGTFDYAINHLSSGDLLTASKNAQIILKIDDAQEMICKSKWDEIEKFLIDIGRYQRHKNPTLASEIFKLLEDVVEYARSGITQETAGQIYNTVINYFPSFDMKDDQEERQLVALCQMCCDVASSLMYDAAIYLTDHLNIVSKGLLILKHVYEQGRYYDRPVITDKVQLAYDEIELTLQRPSRQLELAPALELVRCFRAELDNHRSYPDKLPEHLRKTLFML